MLASKTALAARYDALGEDVNTEMGVENRAKLEIRIRSLEDGKVRILYNLFLVSLVFIHFLKYIQIN